MPVTQALHGPIFIGLGANTGHPPTRLAQAREAIARRIGPLQAASRIYLSEPWGNPDQPWFHNQVVQVESALSAREVLQTLLDIEAELGRVRHQPNDPREIDLDLLFYGEDRVEAPGCRVPHPRLTQRNFVLIPLMEIAPDFIHPDTGQTIEAHYLHSPDTLEVCLIDEL